MLFADLFSNPMAFLGMSGLMGWFVLMWMLKHMGGAAKGVAQRGAASWISHLFK
jgi:hypothetical protein